MKGLEDAINELNLIVNELPEKVQFAKEGAINNTRVRILSRIFDKREDANNKSLGKYSTKPIFIGAKSFKTKGDAQRFFGKAETNDTKGFRTLRSGRKAYLLPGGYKELRELNNLQSSEVDLTFSGDLKKSIDVFIEGGRYYIAFIDGKNTDKGRGFEENRQTPVFSASDEEVDESVSDFERLLFDE